MKDYIVTHEYYGTLQFTPRVVRANNHRQAAEAVLVDLNRAEDKLRKLRTEKKRGAYESRSTCKDIFHFQYSDGALVVMDMPTSNHWNGHDFKERNGYVRLKADGTFVTKINRKDGR